MTITIDDKDIKGIKLTPDEARLDFALGLYIDNKVTLGQASHIADISQSQFLKELGKRKIPVHYDIEEFKKDLTTLKNFNLY